MISDSLGIELRATRGESGSSSLPRRSATETDRQRQNRREGGSPTAHFRGFAADMNPATDPAEAPTGIDRQRQESKSEGGSLTAHHHPLRRETHHAHDGNQLLHVTGEASDKGLSVLRAKDHFRPTKPLVDRFHLDFRELGGVPGVESRYDRFSELANVVENRRFL